MASQKEKTRTALGDLSDRQSLFVFFFISFGARLACVLGVGFRLVRVVLTVREQQYKKTSMESFCVESREFSSVSAETNEDEM